MDPLYTSPVLAARREVSSLALCSEDGEALQAPLFHGGVSRQWESASRVIGAWGASPADGSSAFASSRPRWRVSTAALLKACWRWNSG